MWLDTNLKGHSSPPNFGVKSALFGHAVKQGQDILKNVLVGDGMQKRPEGSELTVICHSDRWNPGKDNRRKDTGTTYCLT